MIITTKEARKILGKSASDMSDDQIVEVIIYLQMNATKYVASLGSKT